MCTLLHRYTVFDILFANGIPFYNSGSVCDIHLLVQYLCFATLHVLVVDNNHNLYSRIIAVSI